VGVWQPDVGLEFVDLREVEVPPMKNCVRELREARGWTQVEFGDRLNVSRQTIYAIETGLYDPSLPLALAIAKLLGQPVEEIFGNDAKKRKTKSSRSDD
jgi:putative transcriptional regulator